MNIKNIITLTSVGLLVMGCMSTPKSDIQPDWRSSEVAKPLSAAHVLHDGERIAFSTDRNVYLLNGSDGRVVSSLAESWLENATRNMQVGARGISASMGQFMASSYDIVPISEHNLILLFDYQFGREIVVAMDSENGELLWSANNYEFSLNKYENLIATGADMIGQQLGRLLGAQHQGEDEQTRRQRQVNFLDTVVHPIPGTTNIAFKTFNGVYILNSRTGEEVGRVADFRGAGLAAVLAVGDDLIIVGGARNVSLTLGVATGYDIARVSMNGQVRWKAEHSGTRTMGLIRAGNTVLINGGPTEAFDINTGQKLWQNDVTLHWPQYHQFLVDGEYIYFASDLNGQIGRVEESKVWKQHARTGQVVWETNQQRGYYHGLEKHGNKLLATGRGQMFTDQGDGLLVLNADTGQVEWSTPAFEKASMFSSLNSFSAAVVKDDLVYITDLSHLYGFQLASGEPVFRHKHASRGTNGVIDLVSFEDKIFMVGRDAVVAYQIGTGDMIKAMDTERTASMKVKGERIVLSNGRGITQTVHMRTVEPSPVVRHSIRNHYFGTFDEEAYVTQNGRYKYTVSDKGQVMRFSF